jgi:HK97 family phage major capsid protein
VLLAAEAYGQSIADARRWHNAGMTEAQVRADIMDRDARRVAPVGAAASTEIALSDKERKQYSVGRLVMALATGDWTQAGLEREVSNTMAKRMGRAAIGAYIPTDQPLFKSAVMTTGSAGKGAELVYPEYQGFVDLLRPRSVLAQLGATMRSGLQGTYSFVRQTSGSSVEWVGENPNADPTESDIGTEIVESNPKTAAGLLRYTRQQLAQSIEAFDSLVRKDLVAKHATEMDRVGIAGTGANGQPLGLTGYSGVTVRALGTNGAAPDYGDIINLESDLDLNNAEDLGTRAFLTTVAARGVPEADAAHGQHRRPPDLGEGEMAGFRAEASNNAPSTLTKGTAAGVCHLLAHGVFSELLLHEWGALDITVDPITQAARGVIRVISHHMMNVEVRQPKAFTLIKDALVG